MLACRLVALDKNAGVRPIGVPRRIIAKAVLSVVVMGFLQLCAGQISGVEAAAHTVHQLFDDPATEDVLLVDAENAFNSLNRQVALRNIQYLCPSLATILVNCYHQKCRSLYRWSDTPLR